jgi:hypothetical protein
VCPRYRGMVQSIPDARARHRSRCRREKREGEKRARL